MARAARVFLFFGEAGTGKSSCALGEDEVDDYEFDIGSLDRTGIVRDNIHLHQYMTPLTNLLDEGVLAISDKGGVAPQTGHRLQGWKPLWWGFVKDYLENLSGPGRPVFDTETKLWLTIRQGWLEQVQDAVGPERDRLEQLQYTEPNARHSQLVDAARAKGKDLVMLAHESEVYLNNKATGILKPDSYKEMPNIADCTVRFTLEQRKPVGTIYKAGRGGLELIGLKIPEPTLEKINQVLDVATALRRGGYEVPTSYDDLMERAEMLA